jgi:5-bromo-4-chloroindolyl phosphate hydrolysis protein
MKVRLQEKMKKIIGLTDEQIKSKDIKDIERIMTSYKDITSVYQFFINYPQFEKKAREFFEE